MTLELAKYLIDPRAGAVDWAAMTRVEAECRFEWQLATELWVLNQFWAL